MICITVPTLIYQKKIYEEEYMYAGNYLWDTLYSTIVCSIDLTVIKWYPVLPHVLLHRCSTSAITSSTVSIFTLVIRASLPVLGILWPLSASVRAQIRPEWTSYFHWQCCCPYFPSDAPSRKLYFTEMHSVIRTIVVILCSLLP